MKKKNFIIVLSVLVIILVIEVFGFNYRYFLLPKEERGIFPVDMEKLELINMKIENDCLVSLDDSASVKFNNSENENILGLRITPASNSAAFEVTISYPNLKKGNTKINLVDSRINSIATIEIGNEDEIINFNKYLGEIGRENISIKGIEVDNRFNFNLSRFFLFFSLITVLFILIINYKFFTSKLHITFIVIVLTFGINIVYLMPTYFSFDEREHFIKAYQTASFDFGIEGDKRIGWPEDIDSFFTFNGKSTSFDSFKEKEAYYDLFGQNKYDKMEYYGSTAKTYMPTAYTPAAIGIFIGKLLSVSIATTFYLGRLFNLFFYSIIIFFSIKYIKVAKKIVFILGLLPAMLYVSCSYSADPVTYSFSIAVVSIFCNMFFAEKRTLSFKIFLLFLGCTSIMITGKMTYIPLGLLIILVPNDNFRMTNKKIILSKIVGMIFLGGVLLLNLIYSAHNGLAQWPIEGVNTKEQVVFILGNLPQYFNICLNFILDSLPTYFEGPIGNFAYSGSFSSGISVATMTLLFLLTTIDNNEITENFKFAYWQKMYILLLVIFAWILTITSLYVTFTPVGASSILGVQGRYFAPLIFPLMLLFKTDKIKNYFKEIKLNLCIICGIFFLLTILAFKLFIQFSI